MRLYSSVFVETGVLDGPLQNEKFAQNSVNEITNSYKNSNQIFYFARVDEDGDPYDRTGCKTYKFLFIFSTTEKIWRLKNFIKRRRYQSSPPESPPRQYCFPKIRPFSPFERF